MNDSNMKVVVKMTDKRCILNNVTSYKIHSLAIIHIPVHQNSRLDKSVVLGFEVTFNRDAQVFRLVTRQLGQVDCQSRFAVLKKTR